MERAMVEADITFRPKSEGGRPIPAAGLSGLQYRPHIVIGDPHQREAVVGPDGVGAEEYLGVAFESGPHLVVPGQELRVTMMLMYWPETDYLQAVPGATFTVREGARIVAHGRIRKRWNEPWQGAEGAG
jgi:hypothetical protein